MEIRRYYEYLDADERKIGSVWRIGNLSPRVNAKALEADMVKHILHAVRVHQWKDFKLYPPLTDAEIMTKANEVAKFNGEEPRWTDDQIHASSQDTVTKIIVLGADGTQSEASTTALSGGVVKHMTPPILGPATKIIVPAEVADVPESPLSALENQAHGVGTVAAK